jgi:hypothetical protein
MSLFSKANSIDMFIFSLEQRKKNICQKGKSEKGTLCFIILNGIIIFIRAK